MEDNILDKVFKWGEALNEATKYSGITDEQASKFLSKFMEVSKSLEDKEIIDKKGDINIDNFKSYDNKNIIDLGSIGKIVDPNNCYSITGKKLDFYNKIEDVVLETICDGIIYKLIRKDNNYILMNIIGIVHP